MRDARRRNTPIPGAGPRVRPYVDTRHEADAQRRVAKYRRNQFLNNPRPEYYELPEDPAERGRQRRRGRRA